MSGSFSRRSVPPYLAMAAPGLDASIDALERQTVYAGGEISPDMVASLIERRRNAVLTAVELLERSMAENRALRSELEGERHAIDDFTTFLSGDVPADEPTAWGSGVRKLVGYAPGKVSTAVSERGIDAWLKQTHQKLSSRAEKARQRIEPLGERARVLDATVDSLRQAAAQAQANRDLALGAVRRALELHDTAASGANRATDVAIRHARVAECFAEFSRGCTSCAVAVETLAAGVRELVERTRAHASSAGDRLASAREAVIAVDWSAEASLRHSTAKSALSSLGDLIERNASYVGDVQLVARQQVQRWKKTVAELDSELADTLTARVAAYANDGIVAAQSLVKAS